MYRSKAGQEAELVFFEPSGHSGIPLLVIQDQFIRTNLNPKCQALESVYLCIELLLQPCIDDMPDAPDSVLMDFVNKKVQLVDFAPKKLGI